MSGTLAGHRHRAILGRLAETGVVEVDELSRALAVSSATVRRDLRDLQDQGRLVRHRGGAVVGDGRRTGPPAPEGGAAGRDGSGGAQAREQVLSAAMSLVPTGATVGVVGGRWVGDLAPALLGVRPTVVVTTSTVLAGRLDDEVPVVLPPGRHDGRGEVVGRSVAECLDALRLDVVLVGACGTTPAGVRLSGRPGLASSLVRSAAPGGVVVLEPGSSDRGTDEGEVLDAGAVDVLVVGRHDAGRMSPGVRRRVGRVVLAG